MEDNELYSALLRLGPEWAVRNVEPDLRVPASWASSGAAPVRGTVRLAPDIGLHGVERRIEGPEPIERTLYLNSDLIAVAYLNSPPTEATLAWPLSSNAPLDEILDCYVSELLRPYRSNPSEYVFEFWIGDRYHQATIGLQPNDDLTDFRLSWKSKLQLLKSQEPGSLRLLQITSEGTAMELLFDESSESPVRLAVLISAVPVIPLAKLFSRFHTNDEVRKSITIAVKAFMAGLLYPLLKVEE